MKLLHLKSIIIALLCITTVTTYAQQAEAKQKLFADKPSTVIIDNITLANAVYYTQGSLVTINLSPTFQFTGTVISNLQVADNTQSIVVKATDNNQSFLQITRVTNKDNSVKYAGSLINENAADGFILKNYNGNYSLQKFETANVLDPCKL